MVFDNGILTLSDYFAKDNAGFDMPYTLRDYAKRYCDPVQVRVIIFPGDDDLFNFRHSINLDHFRKLEVIQFREGLTKFYRHKFIYENISHSINNLILPSSISYIDIDTDTLYGSGDDIAVFKSIWIGSNNAAVDIRLRYYSLLQLAKYIINGDLHGDNKDVLNDIYRMTFFVNGKQFSLSRSHYMSYIDNNDSHFYIGESLIEKHIDKLLSIITNAEARAMILEAINTINDHKSANEIINKTFSLD